MDVFDKFDADGQGCRPYVFACKKQDEEIFVLLFIFTNLRDC